MAPGAWARTRPPRSPPERAGLTGERPATAAAAPIDRALIEKWARFHLDRYSSSAENLRRVLQRRVRRRLGGDDEAVPSAGALIEARVRRYRATGRLGDSAYAAGRTKSGLSRAPPPLPVPPEL